MHAMRGSKDLYNRILGGSEKTKDGGGFDGSVNSAPHIFDYNKNRKFS
jgi:hypothetical protein